MHTPTHTRQILVADDRIQVIGDFGGGYSGPLPPRGSQARLDQLMRALIYMPGAQILGLTPAEKEHLGL